MIPNWLAIPNLVSYNSCAEADHRMPANLEPLLDDVEKSGPIGRSSTLCCAGPSLGVSGRGQICLAKPLRRYSRRHTAYMLTRLETSSLDLGLKFRITVIPCTVMTERPTAPRFWSGLSCLSMPLTKPDDQSRLSQDSNR